MHEACLQELNSVFQNVVERLAFMFGEPVAMDTTGQRPEPWAEARMAFEGEVSGSLAIIVPQSLQPEIAANILGLDSSDLTEPSMLADALCEMLNVVCGQVVMALAGSAADFFLRTPVYGALSRERLAELRDDPDSMGFLLDGHPLLLRLALERPR